MQVSSTRRSSTWSKRNGSPPAFITRRSLSAFNKNAGARPARCARRCGKGRRFPKNRSPVGSQLIARRKHNRRATKHGCRFATGSKQAGTHRALYSLSHDEKFANTANWFTFSRAANSRLFILPPLVYVHVRLVHAGNTCTRVYTCICARATIDFETATS